METKTDEAEGEDGNQPAQRNRILFDKNVPIPVAMMG
jgi:hypothetical protein